MIPVAKPKLPTAEKLLPYLKRIDANRHYTNFGPLVLEFEQRLAEWMQTDKDYLSTFSNGTVALEIALRALNPFKGSFVIMPSWTFSATAHATMACGLQPFFMDVDPVTWALTPALATAAMKLRPGKIAAVMPVAPFGQVLPMDEWEAFSKTHNVPVIIDGATMIPTDVRASTTVSVMVSLHATKVLNTGEGALLIKKDADYIKHTREMSTFGITTDGILDYGTNAKMSEYHAAVGQASLDEWDSVVNDFTRVAKRYAKNLSGQKKIKLLPGFGETRFNSTCIAEWKGVDPGALNKIGIGTRQWWRRGCHYEPAFSACAKLPLPVSEYLADNYTGLPCFRDLADADIDSICQNILKL